jgi:YjbE family integral membrane protein
MGNVIDLASALRFEYSWEFFLGICSVILIDIVLAGDNAVVIAMAVKSLPKDKRRFAIIFGAGLAVLLRVILTFFAAQLLHFSYVKFIGGLLILWIAVKLLAQDSHVDELKSDPQAFWQAIWIIVVADATMSLDNVLALAGASKGNLFLLLFGLALSIPLVVFASSLLAQLMDRYPIIIYIGAAVLGKVGGELMVTDRIFQDVFHLSAGARYAVEAFFAVAVIVAARIFIRWKRRDLKNAAPSKAHARTTDLLEEKD